MSLTDQEAMVLAALDEQGLLSAFRTLLRIPSVTSQEAEAQRWLAQHMQELGLDVDLWSIDVADLQKHPHFPGMEVDRSSREALGLVGQWHANPNTSSPKTLIFNGHIDVVPEGDVANWHYDPWGATLDERFIYGRGACDMKGGLIAALYAIKAIKNAGFPGAGSLLIHSVIGEEDGGLGTFASILRGHTGDAAIICEPTRLKLIPAQAGALTFTVHIPGKSAHASVRLEGVSAVEKYLVVHHALLQLETERNSHVTHPLMSKLPLPYALNIGRVNAGNWSSSVPEELIFSGRIGVAVGESSATVRHHFEQTLQTLVASDPWLHNHPFQILWNGGQFDAGEIAIDHPLVQCGRQAMLDLAQQELEITGAPYGSDLRLFVNFAHIPALLLGPGDVRVAHMPDEHINIDELIQAARLYILIAMRFLSNQC